MVRVFIPTSYSREQYMSFEDVKGRIVYPLETTEMIQVHIAELGMNPARRG